MEKALKENNPKLNLDGISSSSAVAAAGSLAHSMTLGKTASDIASVERAGGESGYVNIMEKTATNQMSDKIGTNDEMVKAFNIKREAVNIARGVAGMEPLPMYDTNASTSQAAQEDFNEFVRDTEEKKAAARNAIPQAMTILGEAGTALVAGAILDKATGGHAVKRFGRWKNSFFSKSENSVPNKSENIRKDKQKNPSSEDFKNQHNMTPEEVKSQSTENLKEGRASYSDYSKEHKNFQEQSTKEKSNLSDLEKRRDTLKKDGKSTAKIDQQIDSSREKIKGYDKSAELAERKMNAQEYLNNKEKAKLGQANEQINNKKRAPVTAKSIAKSIGKNTAVAIAVDAVMREATQAAVDNGYYRTGNALATTNDVVSGVYGTLMGSATYAAGVVDKGLSLFTGGYKPIGSAVAAAYSLTGGKMSSDLTKVGSRMIDSSGQDIANAVVHTEAAINGDKNVHGMKKGGSTTFGNMLGYGSVSKQVSEVFPSSQTSDAPSHLNNVFAKNNIYREDNSSNAVNATTAMKDEVTTFSYFITQKSLRVQVPFCRLSLLHLCKSCVHFPLLTQHILQLLYLLDS